MKTKTFCNEDQYGNKLYAELLFDDDSSQPMSCQLKLVLANDSGLTKRFRRIGNYDYSTKTLYVSRSIEKHLHYQSNSYGFNWNIVNEKTLFTVDKISLNEQETGAEYVFPVSLLKERGVFLHFKKQGFELQRFLNRKLIENYKINQPV